MIGIGLLAVGAVIDHLIAFLAAALAFLRLPRRRTPRSFATMEEFHAAVRAAGCEPQSEATRLRGERERLHAERAQLLAERAAARGRIHHPKGHPVSFASIDELMPIVVEVDP